MIDAKDCVPVEQFDILLLDLRAEDIAKVKMDDIELLSTANEATPMPTMQKGMTSDKNTRILAAAIISCKRQGKFNSVNVVVLVDAGALCVFLTARTWKNQCHLHSRACLLKSL